MSRRRSRLIGPFCAAILLTLADACRATPPAVLDVWIHPERVQEAASVFGDRERRWFANELTTISGPDFHQVNRASPPFVGLRGPHFLSRAMIGLICPSLQQGDVQKINAFFTMLDKRNAIRGRGNYAGWTRVSYRLTPVEGQPWRLEEHHQPVSGPGERAVPRLGQGGTSFIIYIDCDEPDHRAIR